MSNSPIGIFDSGVGGTSIWREIHKLLPHENTIYLADSKNAPYGPKGKERITELSIKNTELLLQKGCKLIVVACNTATTNSIQHLRETYNVPFIGIEPAIKPAALQTKSKTIGILATKGTLSSELFHKTTDLYANGVKIIEQIGEGLVQLIEDGHIESPEMENLLHTYLQPMLDANIDYLVLGCSHYPYLIPKLKTLLPKHVTIIDSGIAVANQTKAILEHYHLLNSASKLGTCTFYSNRNPVVLRKILQHEFSVEALDF
ncbi:glutamate racemase [Kordia sp. YSTF-M3]|uniref:Glutamate racemase n=1 Tax=Kordia aestuariivivens TaxID=2759037 RepID=A0ABR7Q3I5_9FLAO|nr:glutamate racemase [Kordia aestuariivivens]MBC8753114.1 glutamate racemase [Kordia aestuariivivens]